MTDLFEDTDRKMGHKEMQPPFWTGLSTVLRYIYGFEGQSRGHKCCHAADIISAAAKTENRKPSDNRKSFEQIIRPMLLVSILFSAMVFYVESDRDTCEFLFFQSLCTFACRLAAILTCKYSFESLVG